MQKTSFLNGEYLVKIILHCLFPKLMYGTCCTFSVKSILNPLNIAFNNGFRKKINFARHTRVWLIINGFNFLPVSLTIICNLFYVIQHMLKIDKFQQLIFHLLLKSNYYYDLMATYMILIYMYVKLKLSKSCNNCMHDVSPSVAMFILILFECFL